MTRCLIGALGFIALRFGVHDVSAVMEVGRECAEQFGRNSTIEAIAAVGCWRLVSKLARSLAITLEGGIESWAPDGKQP